MLMTTPTVSSTHGFVVMLSLLAPLVSLTVAGIVMWSRHMKPTGHSPFASVRQYFYGDRMVAESTTTDTEPTEETPDDTVDIVQLPKGLEMSIFDEV